MSSFPKNTTGKNDIQGAYPTDVLGTHMDPRERRGILNLFFLVSDEKKLYKLFGKNIFQEDEKRIHESQ